MARRVLVARRYCISVRYNLRDIPTVWIIHGVTPAICGGNANMLSGESSSMSGSFSTGPRGLPASGSKRRGVARDQTARPVWTAMLLRAVAIDPTPLAAL